MLVIVELATSPWREVALYKAPWTWAPAGFLFATGITLYAKSAKGFSAKQLGGLPEVHGSHGKQRLVTEGVRAHVRHPVYLAHLCEMLAWSMGTGLAVCWALTAFAIATGAVMIRLEDAELEKRFGDEYGKYHRAVPAVVPKVNRTSFLLVLMTAIFLITLISAFLVFAAARKDQPMLFQHGTPEVPGPRAFVIMNPFRSQDSEHAAERLIRDIRTTGCERVVHNLSSDERICPVLRDNRKAHLMWRQDSDSAQLLVYDLPDVEARLWVSLSRRKNTWEVDGLSIVR